MTQFLIENMAPIMFISLFVMLLIGYPVAFSLAANGLIFAVVGIYLDLFQPSFLQAMPERIYGIMNNEVLLAIPFFTFMGLILERSGMAEDLLDTIGQLFGPVRGGLAYAVVFVGALLAATTGVVAASVISMGLISLPIMMRYGYNKPLASGVIAASGTLAQIIPPSLVLIIMADQLGRSVGDMYEGALIPGLILASLYAGYIFLQTIINPQNAPALPKEARNIREPNGDNGMMSLSLMTFATFAVGFISYAPISKLMTQGPIVGAITVALIFATVAAFINKIFRLNLLSIICIKVIQVLIPPLALILLVLGTIFAGIATPTEGGAMGAAGALLLAMAKRKISFGLLHQALDGTAKLSAFVMFILIGARVFSLTFYGVDGHKWVEHLLISMPGGVIGFLIVVNIIVFILAFFLDFFELCFIIVPLLAPAAHALGIDLIWFGVMLSVNMQTSFMHPPFGFALFYLRSVAPKESYIDKITQKRITPITTGQIYWGAVPYVIIQIIMVGLVIMFPRMVTHYKDGAIKLDNSAVEKQLNTLPGLNMPPIELPQFNIK